jgi:hypothetical protein
MNHEDLKEISVWFCSPDNIYFPMVIACTESWVTLQRVIIDLRAKDIKCQWVNMGSYYAVKMIR